MAEEIIAYATAAGLAMLLGWACTPGLLVVQARMLRRYPQLNLRTRYLGPSLLVLAIELVLTLCAGWIGFWCDQLLLAPIVSVVVGAWFAFRRTIVLDLYGVDLALKELGAGKSERGVRRARATVDRLRRTGNEAVIGHIALALARTARVHVGDEAALRILDGVEYVAFATDVLDWTLVLERAEVLVGLNRCEAAERALNACGRRWSAPTDELRECRDVIYARVRAATGDHDAVLEAVKDRSGAAWDLVRAHAFAAAGQAGDAIAALERVREQEGGAGLLALVAQRNGPAAALARNMLTAPPFR